MVAGAAKPTQEEVQAFYDANRENFRNPEMFRAAHVVKHVNYCSRGDYLRQSRKPER
jgi:hypothetical protein